eukprot:scaffold39048_cov30-Tisochrysis_lutea.AAC.1
MQREKFLANLNWRAGVPEVDRQTAADMAEMVQERKDMNLAMRDTRRWCVDRCLNTGHCDAVEDILHLSTKEVIQFCTDCAELDGCTIDDREKAHGAVADDG